MGMPEALKVMLPYSKKYFEVPNNLHILGTMNTADRSVEALDAALRRRFSFTEMPPSPELLTTERRIWEVWWKHLDKDWFDPEYSKLHTGLYDLLGIDNSYDSDEKIWKRMLAEGKNENQIEYLVDLNPTGIKLDELLITINTRIEKLLDKDHQIGHSYFLSVYSIVDLKSAFQNKIIPLLKEYFFGDYGKIGLVLGKGFVERNTNKTIFAEFDAELASELSERPSYNIKNVLQMPEEEFRVAIDLLIGSK
jgi:5-methylcytosine-specific restriction protein B